jgi:hypothetical protein
MYFCGVCHANVRRPIKKVPDEEGILQPMSDDDMKSHHVCTMHWCRECERRVDDEHLCFVKKVPAKRPSNKIMFFDFETRVDGDVHVVNHVHARYFKPSPPGAKPSPPIVEVEQQPQRRSRFAPLDEDAQLADDTLPPGAQPSPLTVEADEQPERRSRFAKMDEDAQLADDREWKGEWVEMTFRGDNAISEFLGALIVKKRFSGYTIIAHNFRGFDGVLLLREMLNRNTIPDCILRGQKVMTMRVRGCNIRFVDSYNFLPMGLAKLPGAFGLEIGEKGYFPHLFNVKENETYVGPLPDAHYYGVDEMGEEKRRKFMEWYEGEKSRGAIFDMQAEIAAYCRQDVEILAESCLAYRRLMCMETGVDPLQYITCASVCKAVFLHMFLQRDTIARVPPAGYSKHRYSEESLEWLEHQRLKAGFTKLEHIANCASGERKIAGYKVDGFDPDSRTIFEYYGCRFHGCPHCTLKEDPRATHPYNMKPLYVCFQKTLRREEALRGMNYKVEAIWACQWRALKAENPDVQAFVEELDVPKPLNPRDAFFGGRTETFKLHVKDVPMAYEDVTSLYPWVNATKRYPVGHPTVKYPPVGEVNIEEYFGLVKCQILPPRDLYLPVLPMHVGPTKKLIFALCRACALSMQVEVCRHSEEERTLRGVWFSEEVKLALSKGYVMKKVEIVWHFEQTSTVLFAPFIVWFYKEKVLSSKPPYKDPGQMKQFLLDLKVRDGVSVESVDEFVENAAKRSLSKLLLNNLWGRFGMRENLTKSCFVSSFEKLARLLDDKSKEVTGVRIITPEIIQVAYTAKTVDDLPMSRDTNIFIAVITTAWARMRLYEELDRVGDRVVYCDTDSVIYVRSEKPEENLVTGPFLGQMTNELKEGENIVEFSSGGPKNYAYRTNLERGIVRVRGFFIDVVNATGFTHGNVTDVIVTGVRNSPAVDDDDQQNRGRKRLQARRRRGGGGRNDHESMRQQFLKGHLAKGAEAASAIANTEGISCFNPRRIFRSRDFQVLKKAEQKMYTFCFDKRIVLENFDTLPYGYVGDLG